MKVLITGPAGFIGSKLLPILLEQKINVIGYDNLKYGYHTLLPYLGKKNFHFINDDIQNIQNHLDIFDDLDGIIHLAAVVGFPACHKYPDLANKVNLLSTKKIVDLKKKDTFFIYASTCSNYGHRGTDKACDEDAPLKPLTEYGFTKTESEKYVLEKENTTALRIATAFGISPRLRLDLLLNNFIIKALTEKKIDIFESFHRRSFIHISDIANSFNFAIKNINIMKKQAFNVGDESLNFTKLELANQIKKIIDCEITEGKGRDSDQRDYVIDFKKINKIGFKCAIDLENGIKETADAIKYLIKTGEFEKFRDFYKNI